MVCTDDPWGSTTVPAYTTLATLSGTADLNIKLGPGPNAILSHGSTTSLGTDEEAVECSGGCTVSATGVTKGLYFYQLTRGSNSSRVKAVVIQ